MNSVDRQVNSVKTNPREACDHSRLERYTHAGLVIGGKRFLTACRGVHVPRRRLHHIPRRGLGGELTRRD